MNSFLKSILITAAIAVAASCTKEAATGGSGGEAQIRLSVAIADGDATKTYLGQKEGNIYHTFWHAGDRISLNGVPSVALGAEQEGLQKASFVFRGGLYSPFNILYPATTQTDVVSIPAEQQYVEGSFDPSAAPMWASTSKYEDVTLKHLSSLLRLSLKDSGEETVLKSLSLTAVGGEAISGDFRIEKDAKGFFTGAITPTEGSSDLKLSFGEEGLALKATPTLVYVAIPAGNYSSGFKLTLRDNNGKAMMLSFFGAQAKSIAQSKVLEFPEVQYTPDSDDTLHIWDASDFIKLSSTAATKVYIHNDIDLEGVSWGGCTTGFNGTIDGMNHTVSNISSRTFVQKAETKADLIIKNLTFTGCKNTIVTFGGGTLEIDHCRFIDNIASGASVPVLSVPTTALTGWVRVSCCDFIGNSPTPSSLTTSIGTVQLAGQIPVYFTNCLFVDNYGNSYGSAIHSSKVANSLLALNNCLFYGNANKGTNDPAVMSIGTAKFIMLNSTVIQSVPSYKYAVRCGASGGMDSCFLAGNIVTSVSASGYSFFTAAATYFERSVGYNQYCDACPETSAKVSLKETYSWTKTGGQAGIKDNVVGVPDYYTVPKESNGYLWSWKMPEEKISELPSLSDFEKLLLEDSTFGGESGAGTAFINWLKSVKVGDHTALETDLYGNVRDAQRMWPGCYQK